MEKWLCWAAMGIASGLFLLFLFDLILKFPFFGLNMFVDIVALLACAIVFYLAWDAFKDLR